MAPDKYYVFSAREFFHVFLKASHRKFPLDEEQKLEPLRMEHIYLGEDILNIVCYIRFKHISALMILGIGLLLSSISFFQERCSCVSQVAFKNMAIK